MDETSRCWVYWNLVKQLWQLTFHHMAQGYLLKFFSGWLDVWWTHGHLHVEVSLQSVSSSSSQDLEQWAVLSALLNQKEIRTKTRIQFMTPESSERVVSMGRLSGLCSAQSAKSVQRGHWNLKPVWDIWLFPVVFRPNLCDICQPCYSKKLIVNGLLYPRITKSTTGSLSNVLFE